MSDGPGLHDRLAAGEAVLCLALLAWAHLVVLLDPVDAAREAVEPEARRRFAAPVSRRDESRSIFATPFGSMPNSGASYR